MRNGLKADMTTRMSFEPKAKNGYIDGKADAYESSLREFKRIFNMKEE